MGAYLSGVKIPKPSLDGKMQNAYLDGKKVFAEADGKEYGLVFTGTQWLKTEHELWGEYTKAEMDFSYTGGSSHWLFGARRNGTQNMMCVMVDPAGQRLLVSSRMQADVPVAGILPNVRYKIVYEKTSVFIDGVLRVTVSGGSFSTDPGKCAVGAMNQGGTIMSPFSGTAYGFRLWKDGTLLHDFVPVPAGSVKWSATPAPVNCAWDTVAGLYRPSDGSGDFGIREV